MPLAVVPPTSRQPRMTACEPSRSGEASARSMVMQAEEVCGTSWIFSICQPCSIRRISGVAAAAPEAGGIQVAPPPVGTPPEVACRGRVPAPVIFTSKTPAGETSCSLTTPDTEIMSHESTIDRAFASVAKAEVPEARPWLPLFEPRMVLTYQMRPTTAPGLADSYPPRKKNSFDALARFLVGI